MKYLFTSESVSEGHPDKVADQISDAVLDEYLRLDENAKVACETLCTTGLVVIAGEVHTDAHPSLKDTVRRTIEGIGYNKGEYMFEANSCGILNAIHGQSPDINQGVERSTPDEQGAGDQGMMFGYACRDTEEYMPLPLSLAHHILLILKDIRNNHIELMPYLRPDAKSQFTVEYDSATGKPVRIDTIVVSTQHDDFGEEKEMQEKIRRDIEEIVIPRLIAELPEETAALFRNDWKLHVNPTGKFVIGGPHGDTGLTGRKIIVDTYGGKGAHGGGAFSGKDPSKVDRSAAYAARYIAKNMVAAGIADEMLVQVAYAIGVADPVGVFVNTYGTGKFEDAFIAEKIRSGEIISLKPARIIEKFGLKNPIYKATASYGHFGKKPYTEKLTLVRDGREVSRDVRFFAWEELDSVEAVRKAFGLA